MTIHINTPKDLIASLPPLMGFVPSESVVPIVFNSMANIVSILRIDFDAAPESFDHIKTLIEGMDTASHLAVLVVGPQPGTPEFPMEQILKLYTPQFRAHPHSIQIYAVPRLVAGAAVLDVNEHGIVGYLGILPDWKETEIAAEQILRGGSTVEDSEMGIISMFLQEMPPPLDNYTGTDIKAWVRSAYDEELRPPNQAIWEWLEESVDHRDWVVGQILNDPGRTFSEFAAVARSSGGKGREEALSIAGVAAYSMGRGAHALVAFQLAQHEAMERGEEAVLASIAGTMVQNGLPPEKIREVCQRAAEN